MTHPSSRDYDAEQDRLRVRIRDGYAEIVRPRPAPPVERIGSDIEPRLVLWAMAAVVGVCLLVSGLATVWAVSAPQVEAVSDDGGGRVP